MSGNIEIDTSHIPLLNSVMYNIQNHIEELLVLLSKLCEVREHLPESQDEKRRHMDILIQNCSVELDWNIRTYKTYKGLRDTVLPTSLDLPISELSL